MIGKIIENARKSKYISKAKLAELSGLNRCTIWKIESGHSAPNFETLAAIATALDVDPSIFFEKTVTISQ